ncbi:MAG: AMP-binding protein [Burkholderiaceae bacterium]
MTVPDLIPLCPSTDLDAVVAWQPQGPRRLRDLLADAHALARCLPPGGHLLNVCQDRYRFAVGFVAGLIDGRVSLQPSSQSAETLHRIRSTYPDVVCLADAAFDSQGLPCVVFPQALEVRPLADARVPAWPADRLVAVLFTSGSTGLPQAHGKTWGRLVQNGRVEARRLGLLERPHGIVGTVPVQHSYGFESTFLMALQSGSAFWSGKPFYPQDVVTALERMPEPRLLVTTPFHLSTLLASDLTLPSTALLLSATAPLSGHLASQAEARFGAPVHEIYGSTESGQLASRRTTEGAPWTLLDGVELQGGPEGTVATGGHVEGRVPLSDLIESLPGGRFLLHGRHADLVNIAGKRTSLAYLNHQIGAVPGVVDAAFFLPDEAEHDASGTTRLCAFAVAPGLTRDVLLGQLRSRVDPVFLPRPLVLLDALPRNSTGKLTREALKALYAAWRASQGVR